VLVRQRPGDAKAIFMTLEDETAPPTRYCGCARSKLSSGRARARLISVTGMLQNEYGVIHVGAEHLEDLSPLLHACRKVRPGANTRALRRDQTS